MAKINRRDVNLLAGCTPGRVPRMAERTRRVGAGAQKRRPASGIRYLESGVAE